MRLLAMVGSSSVLHPSTKKLIDKLIEMTRSSKISWSDGGDNTCTYDTEGYRVTIGQSPSRVVILDAAGRVLETVSDGLLSNTRDESGTSYAVKVDQLVSDARREITGAVAVIDRLVSVLDQGNETPQSANDDIADDDPGNLRDFDEDDEDDGDEDEEMVVAPNRPQTSYPDHSEMAFKVRQLAERVNARAAIAPPEPDGWNVPEHASSPPEDTAADYQKTYNGSEGGYSPSDSEGPDDDELLGDHTVSYEPETEADEELSAPQPKAAVSVTDVKPVIHVSPHWRASGVIDAMVVTPSDFFRSMSEPEPERETAEESFSKPDEAAPEPAKRPAYKYNPWI